MRRLHLKAIGLIFIFQSILYLPYLAANSFPKFTNITSKSGLKTNNRGYSASWGDFNNDGLIDLYICNTFTQPNVLYQNLGNGQFRDVTLKAGVGGHDYSVVAWWLDLNSDGHQDLFVVNLNYENKFYLNNGDGTFNEMFKSLGISKGIPAWIDMNHDGLLDVYVGRGEKNYANSETTHNRFFLNMDSTKFKDFSKETFLISDAYSNWPNWHDYDNNNYPDLFSVNTGKKTCYFYRYNSDGTFSNFIRQSAIKDLCGTNYWADLDADGDQDCFLIENLGTNIAFYENQKSSMFRKRNGLPKIKAGEKEYLDTNRAIDIDNDGLLDLQISTHKPYSQFDHRIEFFRNMGDFQFSEIKNPLQIKPDWDVRNLNWADIDNDGDWDCIAVLRHQLLLFRNEGTGNNFIKISLKGFDSHLDGIGATISVTTELGTHKYWVGMGMEYQWRVRDQIMLGIGQADSIKKIRVTWPSGIIQDTTNVEINQTIQLNEPATNWFTDQTKRSQLGNQIAKTMGGSCADYDNDGDIDIYLANNNGPSILYENQGSAVFSDVSTTSKITQSSTQLSAVFFDFDNDGNKDIFTTGWYFQKNSFLKNNGDKTFRNFITEARIADDNDSSLSLIVSDFNNDGFLDLYQGQDGQNVLWLNSGKNYYYEYSKESGTNDPHIAHGIVAFDYDNDGDQDIYVANTRGGEDHYKVKLWPNVLYQNNGDATFKNVTDSAGVCCTANSKGLCFGDYDNDGNFDLYIANDDSANILFHNNGDGTFTDVTSLAGVAEPKGAHGCQFVDFDNDGDLDLYVSGSSYIPEKHNESMQKPHPNKLYRNNGDLTFTDITRYSGIQDNVEQTPHILVADFDNDGYVDVHAGNAVSAGVTKVRNTFFQNRCRGNNYLQLKLTGVKSNRDAIGAKIHVESGNLSLWRQAYWGCGYGSSHSEIINFGLNKNKKIDKLTIYWPSGTIQTLTKDIEVNNLYHFQEPFQIGPIQLSQNELTLTYKISGIILSLGVAFIIFIFLAPIIKKGWSVQKQEKTEIDLIKSGKIEPLVFEVRIDLMPFKSDYLLTHVIRPLTQAAYDSSAFQWGRQEKTPFIFKNDKILALRHRFRNILNQHMEFIQNPGMATGEVLDALKEVGSIIYIYLGLRGFFDGLFKNENMENVVINFIVDNSLIPWYLAYDEQSDSFLCDKFAYSFSLEYQQKRHKPAPNIQQLITKRPMGTKAAITLFGTWAEHERHLSEVPLEIKNLTRLFQNNNIETKKVDANVDEFITTLQKLTDNKNDLRIIHYSGHIEHNLLALGPNEFFDPAQLEKSFGINFENGPVVFLNGCQTSEFWQPEDNIAVHFLNAGAAACIVTHAKIPEQPARRFAELFYEYYVEQQQTIAESLRNTRVAAAQERRYFQPENDVTRYLYNLYGDPRTKF